MADLQEIVDDLEAEIRRPISVEDRRWRLLAHSVQPDEADAVRRSSILTRETSPDVVAWLDGLGLQRARDLVDVPRNDELGMIRRGCLPIRHGDVLLGFLWVIVGDRPLTASERAGLARGGEEVAANLWARHRAADERLRRTREQLAALLAGDRGAASRARRDAALAASTATSPSWSAQETRPSRRSSGAAAPPTTSPTSRATGSPSWSRDPAQLKDSLNVRNGGVSSAFSLLGEASRARAAGRAGGAVRPRAARRSGPSPPTTSSAAGRWSPSCGPGRTSPEPPRQITALAAHRRGDQLLEALEGLLEHGGDVAEAAQALNMHRATLYRRLERIEEITGLDLERGDDRLLAHLGLRLLRLNATTVAPTPR